MRETLNVILNECEGSVTVMREDGKHQKFFYAFIWQDASESGTFHIL